MRTMEVYRNGILAGLLIEESKGQYVFRYDNHYYSDINQPSISLTIPKSKKEELHKYITGVISKRNLEHISF